jgi:competence ComEA-like helix-hairpin-helix protein
MKVAPLRSVQIERPQPLWLDAVLCAGLLAIVIGTVVARAAPATRNSTHQDEDPYAALFNRTCVNRCHTIERVAGSRKNRIQWEETLEKMAKFGLQLTDEEAPAITYYLLREYGKVAVNKVDATEIAIVVGLTLELAQAIVKYRAQHGKFADLNALKAVPGIDVEKLQKKQEALTFD